jgi:hypothetical protein
MTLDYWFDIEPETNHSYIVQVLLPSKRQLKGMQDGFVPKLQLPPQL